MLSNYDASVPFQMDIFSDIMCIGNVVSINFPSLVSALVELTFQQRQMNNKPNKRINYIYVRNHNKIKEENWEGWNADARIAI